MTTLMEKNRARIVRVREELLQASQRKTKRTYTRRQVAPSIDHIITMDVIDGKAEMQRSYRTVREALEGERRQLDHRVISVVMRSFYSDNGRGGWGPARRDDSFDRFVAALRAFSDTLYSKGVWCNENYPWEWSEELNCHVRRVMPPVYDDQHTLLCSHGVGPKTIHELRRVFAQLPIGSEV